MATSSTSYTFIIPIYIPSCCCIIVVEHLTKHTCTSDVIRSTHCCSWYPSCPTLPLGSRPSGLGSDVRCIQIVHVLRLSSFLPYMEYISSRRSSEHARARTVIVYTYIQVSTATVQCTYTANQVCNAFIFSLQWAKHLACRLGPRAWARPPKQRRSAS